MNKRPLQALQSIPLAIALAAVLPVQAQSGTGTTTGTTTGSGTAMPGSTNGTSTDTRSGTGTTTGSSTTTMEPTRAGRMTNTDQKQWERTHRATRIIGTDVRNTQGEKIGDVKDVVLDHNGKIAYAIVSTGGFLGIGDRLHAVPWTALNTSAGKNFVLDVDKARLKNAPSFDSRTWPNLDDDQWASNNRRYFPDWSGSTGSSTGASPQ